MESDQAHIAALGFLAGGVAIFAVAIAYLLWTLRRRDRGSDQFPMGDLPNIPEFIKRRRNDP